MSSGSEKFGAIDVDYVHSVNDLPMVEESEEMVSFSHFPSCLREFKFPICLDSV